MKFQVPIEKDLTFAQNLIAMISENISDLTGEYEKLPNKIIFTHVRSHTGKQDKHSLGNEQADKLATSGAMMS